jgi:hypothetical protein
MMCRMGSLLELPFSEGSDREFLFCSLHCVIGGGYTNDPCVPFDHPRANRRNRRMSQ